MYKTVVFLSDTHGLHDKISVPDGDILIHAGDFCNHGTMEEVAAFGKWLRSLPHKHKIVVAGNHDWPFQRKPSTARETLGDGADGIVYVEDAEVQVEGFRIYGSPWQPEFCDWAFNLPREGWELRAKWAAIPDGLDILVTHGPPSGVLDDTPYDPHVGCEELAKVLPGKAPRVHAFGHVHHSYGECRVFGTLFLNCSTCDEGYNPVNAPHSLVLVPQKLP